MDLKIMDPERPGVLRIRIHLEVEEDWMILSSDGQDTEAVITTTATLGSEVISQVSEEMADNGVVEDKISTNLQGR